MEISRQKMVDDLKKEAADLFWLCFLLTGRQDLSIEIATDAVAEDDSRSFFADWINGWSRKIALAKALGAIRDEIAQEARRTQVAADAQSGPVPGILREDSITKPRIEKALFAIDLFPRAVLVLSIFEGLPMADLVTLLDVDVPLIRKAQAIGLQQFTSNIAAQTFTSADRLSDVGAAPVLAT